MGTAAGIKPRVIFRQDTLVGTVQSADKRKPELPTVNVAGEGQVDTALAVGIEKLRAVG